MCDENIRPENGDVYASPKCLTQVLRGIDQARRGEGTEIDVSNLLTDEDDENES